MPLIVLILLLGSSFGLGAQQAGAPSELRRPVRPVFLDEDASSLLGLDLAAASELFGFPDAVFPVRGDAPWQDDVVFKYSQGYSFFWYKDGLWQIRFDAAYRGSIFGLFKGDTKAKALSLLGKPLFQTEDSLVFELPDRGYPVRLRVVFSLRGEQKTDAAAGEEAKASDFYLYRADF
jgi:hypothetical protein